MSKPSSPTPVSPKCIFYAVGPGDLVGHFRDKVAGKAPAFQLGMAFSEQFLDWCDSNHVELRAISCHFRRDSLRVGPHLLENLPKPAWCFKGGIRFHLGQAFYGLKIAALARRSGADLAIADSGTTHWIVLSVLALFRVPVIAVLHNTLWPWGYPPQRRVNRILRKLDGWFFRNVAAASACVSPECERQVRQVAGTMRGPCMQFRPQYREDFLSRAAVPPPLAARPFRVLFLGRVEESKGIFLILEMAERLERELPGGFAWKIVGRGTARDALMQRIVERGLGSLVDVPGQLRSEQEALDVFGWSHAVIAPTTSQFEEGLAMTAAESVLAGRPVVLSDVVPAWEVLDGAAIKAKTDSVDSFVAILRRLASDAEFYGRAREATTAVQAQFYDRSQGLGNVLGRAIASWK